MKDIETSDPPRHPAVRRHLRGPGRTALAALGSVARLQASGPDRFQTVARAWRRLSDDAVADPPEGPAV